MIAQIAALGLGLFFLGFAVQRLSDLRDERDYLRRVLELRTLQEQRERQQRLIYERALALPMLEPQRSSELWARAHRGDQLAEDILSEALSLEAEHLTEFSA